MKPGDRVLNGLASTEETRPRALEATELPSGVDDKDSGKGDRHRRATPRPLLCMPAGSCASRRRVDQKSRKEPEVTKSARVPKTRSNEDS